MFSVTDTATVSLLKKIADHLGELRKEQAETNRLLAHLVASTGRDPRR